MKKCPKCGELCNDNDKYCSSCSFSLPENPVSEGSAQAASDPASSKEPVKLACLLGAIFTGVYILLSIVYWACSVAERNDYGYFSIRYLLMALAAPLFFAGLITSIIGTATSKKEQKRSKRFGILGITGSVTGLVANILALVLVFVVADAQSKVFGKEEIRRGDYTVNQMAEDPSKAQAVCYYWSGNPKDNYIKPEFCDDGTKIVRLENFTIEVEDSRDYYKTALYMTYRESWPQDRNRSETYKGVKPGTTVYFDNITFNVEIGENIEHVTFSKYDSDYRPATLAVRHSDGSVTFYKYFYNFTVDPGNKVYYAKDGVLYYRKSHKKVKAFYKGEDEGFTYKESMVNPDLVEPDETY